MNSPLIYQNKIVIDWPTFSVGCMMTQDIDSFCKTESNQSRLKKGRVFDVWIYVETSVQSVMLLIAFYH